jgi:hypothetical protein
MPWRKQTKTACAPLLKGSHMNVANPDQLHRKSSGLKRGNKVGQREINLQAAT